jgi:hypothetical protein
MWKKVVGGLLIVGLLGAWMLGSIIVLFYFVADLMS